MKKKDYLALLSAFCLLFQAGTALALSEDPLFESEIADVSSGIFQFGENLAASRALVSYRGKQAREGEWRDDHFIFSGLGESAEIGAEPSIIEKRKRLAIRMNPISRAVRRLEFSQVPPSAALKIWYKLSPAETIKSPEYAYLNIWLGRHLFKRIRISTTNKDWVGETYDLGVVAFLNHEMVVTFDLAANTAVPLEFLLAAELEAS